VKRCTLAYTGTCRTPDLVDCHHIKRRKAGGSDHWTNTILLCRAHHNEWHDAALTDFIARYPSIKQELLDRGWEFEELRKKWFLPHGHPGR